MKTRFVRTAVLLLATVLVAKSATGALGASVTVFLPASEGASGSEVNIPVGVRGAQGLGPLQMDIVYDPAVLEAKMVSEGASLPVGLLDFNVLEPGRLRIAITGDANAPIQGDAELLRLTFMVLGEAGSSSALAIEGLRAWEQTTEAFEMRVTSENGDFTVKASGLPTGLLAIVVAALVVVVVAVLVVLRRRKSTSAV